MMEWVLISGVSFSKYFSRNWIDNNGTSWKLEIRRDNYFMLCQCYALKCTKLHVVAFLASSTAKDMYFSNSKSSIEVKN